MGSFVPLILVMLGASEPEDATSEDDLPEQATGTWGGARTELEEQGLELSGFVTCDWSRIIAGARYTGASTLRSLVDATATLDGERAFGWKGGTAYVAVQWFSGPSMSDYVMDVQVLDNIDTKPFVGITEAWIQQEFFGGDVRMKIGRIEANSEFASVEEQAVALRVRTQRRFLHSSMGFSPTIMRFPSYPRQSLGVMLEGTPHELVRMAGGIFDGTLEPSVFSNLSDDLDVAPFSTLFMVAEMGVGWHFAGGVRPGRLAAGGWGLTPGTEKGTGGTYVVLGQTLWRAKADAKRGVGVFFQHGWTAPVRREVAQHVGAGLAATGPFRSRNHDVLGVGVTWAYLDKNGDMGSETALEGFYRVALAPFVWLQPDVQLVVDPNAMYRDALVATVRLSIEL